MALKEDLVDALVTLAREEGESGLLISEAELSLAEEGARQGRLRIEKRSSNKEHVPIWWDNWRGPIWYVVALGNPKDSAGRSR